MGSRSIVRFDEPKIQNASGAGNDNTAPGKDEGQSVR
jgi:hypothetical protein